jgi:hypothetical protein
MLDPQIKARAQLLRRRNIGRDRVPGLKGRVGAAIGQPAEAIELASLEESDEIHELLGVCRKQAQDDQQPGRRFVFETTERGDIEAYAARVLAAMGDTPMFQFFPEWEYCGAVRLTSSQLLGHVLGLLTLDSDDVLACDATGRRGLVIEYVTEHERDGTRTPTYSLLAWC